jgi:hypothetical protein
VTYGPIGRLRARFSASLYRLTEHALDEMGLDGLSSAEVEESVRSGRIVRIQRDEQGRRKYTIEGKTREGRRVGLVCREDQTGERVVVITVHEVGE